jgi:hypothetical protein
MLKGIQAKLKTEPVIENIHFTEEELEDINCMLIGKPPASILKWWEKKGMDIEQRKKWYTPVQVKDRYRRVQQKYKIGLCHTCRELPNYKFSYPYDGVTLVEYYCEKHFDKLLS